ncbi:MAG: hypothetical protein M3Y44_13320 [Actinomycetota bacterium]|nr:hypothetical protein [Actinomycetota bacterium]
MRLTKLLCTAGVITLGAIGIQLIGAQTASAHTPGVALTCSAWSFGATNYQSDQNNTYSYSLDGAAPVAASFGAQFSNYGTFADGSGNHSLVGHIYQDDNPTATYSQAFDLSATGCSTFIPVPAAPFPTAPTCTASGVATVPADTDTVHWSLNANVAIATAQGANRFTDGTTEKSFTENVQDRLDPNTDGCRTAASPITPAVSQATCDHSTGLDSGFTITLVDTESITYTRSGLLVTATATDGHKIGTLPSGWKSVSTTVATYLATQSDPVCLIDVSPTAPAVVQSVCTGPGTAGTPTVTPAVTAGISYIVSADLSTVTASPGAGYQFGALPTDWVLQDGSAVFATSLLSPGGCTAAVVAIAATFTDDRCASNQPTGATFTVPEITGADFLIDGVRTAAGSYPATAGSTLAVTLQARPGYTLTGPTSWSHTFTAVATCAGVSGESVLALPTPPANVGLASTGVATTSLLLLAGLSILAGAAMCFGGISRRRLRA